jgi:hypothetical protein
MPSKYYESIPINLKWILYCASVWFWELMDVIWMEAGNVRYNISPDRGINLVHISNAVMNCMKGMFLKF